MATNELKGKTIFITGASSGIGEITARSMAKNGMNVVLTARRKENLEKIVNEIKESGGNAIGLVVDVTKEEDQKRAFQKAEETFGNINFVLANAGYFGLGYVDIIENDKAIEDADLVFKTNILGTVITFREGVKALRKSGGGTMIAISSGAGAMSPLSSANNPEIYAMSWSYGPSKSAIDQIVRNSAGLSKQNINVFSVAPHLYQTEMADKAIQSFGISMNEFAVIANPIFPGQPGDPKDLVKVFTALMDKSTAYIPGDVIYCDNDVTYLADVRNQYLYRHSSGEHYIDLEQIRDYRGHFKNEQKNKS